MDYCSSCRRHLNGALVCPGCGAYAPDIAPPTHRVGTTAATAATAWEPYGAEEFPARPEAASGIGQDGATAGGTSTGQGRAARRRQLARWKKNKRRAAAGTALAIVGGALTIAALPTDSGKGGASAAAAPDPTVPDEARKSRPVASPTQPAERATKSPEPRSSEAAVSAPRTAPASSAPTTAPDRAVPARTVSAAPEAPQARPTKAPDSPTTAPATTDPAVRPSPTAPATSGSGADEPQTRPTDTATTSPAKVCLLVLCLG
ncbi:SCO2400 family protein [Streptomyces kurssanovii]|uniref:Uncharacterized protein n=1 Tax=Streptomyces kurssanovii TaxID=67312 RepID=A0ABV3HVP5_9ACTN